MNDMAAIQLASICIQQYLEPDGSITVQVLVGGDALNNLVTQLGLLEMAKQQISTILQNGVTYTTNEEKDND